jgi:hypothetical protein
VCEGGNCTFECAAGANCTNNCPGNNCKTL